MRTQPPHSHKAVDDTRLTLGLGFKLEPPGFQVLPKKYVSRGSTWKPGRPRVDVPSGLTWHARHSPRLLWAKPWGLKTQQKTEMW